MKEHSQNGNGDSIMLEIIYINIYLLIKLTNSLIFIFVLVTMRIYGVLKTRLDFDFGFMYYLINLNN